MSALTILVIVLHVILSAILILFVLLHRGQGGGLSDMFGGGSGGGLQGSAVVERNLDRLTVFAALAFTVTNVTLVLIY
ncbi:MAG: preprotein translocase subunit SecG [Nitriliruptor sp.]|uniref:preprotein translocase subunit SecG n=1 Tax=Nitriliruptor sp. TaxID=2448056 RepID=UPI0034A0071E